MYAVNGGCHCRNILVEMTLTRVPESYHPRACDCDFCTKHAAAYLSDPLGTLALRIRDHSAMGRYVQGNRLAQFILCRNCGVLIVATYQTEERLYGTVNANVVDATTTLGERQIVSPKQLSAAEKPQRWRTLWFPDVKVSVPGRDGADDRKVSVEQRASPASSRDPS